MAFSRDFSNMQLSHMIQRLDDLRKPVINDERQKKYCEYISLFCSHYDHDGISEECQVVGSTKEGLKLRIDKDDGDFDYLGKSWIYVPTSCLEFRKDFPCFVHIKGEKILDKFEGTVNLIDDMYLPASVLRDVNQKAFPILKGVIDLVTAMQSHRSRHTIHIGIRKDIKPGISKVIYNGWKCDKLPNITCERQGDSSKIFYNLQKALKNPKLAGKQKSVVRPVKGILNVINGMRPTENEECDSLPLIYQQLGPLLAVFADNFSPSKKRHSSDHDNEAASSLKITRLSDPSGSEQSTLASTTDKTKSRVYSQSEKPRTSVENVTLTYKSKASKDFIPALRLTGAPECILNWCQQERFWPSPDFVARIRDCPYYVIAKPAVVDPNLEKDFCLGCNEAEMIIAEAMLPLQQKSMLVLKAYQKGELSEFAEDLTSFHWKTALYRLSQMKEEFSYDVTHPSYLIDTDDEVMHFVQEVLEFMKTCLSERRLDHFLCESNLLAGIKDALADEIILRITHIQGNLKECLQQFFETIEDDSIKTELLPLSVVENAMETLHDREFKYEVEAFTTFLTGIAEMHKDDDDTRLTEAITNVSERGFPFFIEEMTRGNRKDETAQERTPAPSGQQMWASLIPHAVSLITDDDDQAKVQLIQGLCNLFKK